jgi:hypothetical protein
MANADQVGQAEIHAEIQAATEDLLHRRARSVSLPANKS